MNLGASAALDCPFQYLLSFQSKPRGKGRGQPKKAEQKDEFVAVETASIALVGRLLLQVQWKSLNSKSMGKTCDKKQGTAHVQFNTGGATAWEGRA